ncbi:MAG: DNRLRE domain-containing protein [Ardenticatenales bacterium]
MPSTPILFAAQVPVGGFASSTSTFGNQGASVEQAPRGGDLVIRYPDGTLRYLTQEAGFGDAGRQGANAIAVREPSVHWSGQKALFSMVVGAPTQRYQVRTFNWQIYEVSGLAQGQTASIRKIAGQPSGVDNVSPVYATDGRILFTSDRPPSGAAHLYPQLDEYESTATVSGIYALDEATGALTLLEHAPSGAFSLSVDSFGRVVFTKWDHLQRDQQGDAPGTAATYGAFTYASEAADAAKSTQLAGAEVFPEPRTSEDPAYLAVLSRHSFNHFFPWEINEDGTAEETLNHIGRHELGGSYTDGSFASDPNLSYYVPENLHANRLMLRDSGGLLHLREDPRHPGEFLTTYAPEFGTASGGTLMRLTAAPSINADNMVLTAVTPSNADAQVPQATGYFRNPLPMTDGTLVASHTAADGQLSNLGSTEAPNWSYAFRLKTLQLQGGFYAPAANLTNGIHRAVSWWTPDVLASFDGLLWEVDAVEVVARMVPTPRRSALPAVEAAVFAQQGVDEAAFRATLRSSGLALIVSRNVTQRDRADRQQPYNLRVPGGVQSLGPVGPSGSVGTIYDVSRLQIFQADALRGYGGTTQPRPGRRVLARPMHAAGVSQAPGAPAGAVTIAPDGSIAALVPAQRALTWQLTDPAGAGIVRERNWISFQAGEIRVCGSCHGVNTLSQSGAPPPSNPPAALATLLAAWKAQGGAGSGGGGASTATPTGATSSTAAPSTTATPATTTFPSTPTPSRTATTNPTSPTAPTATPTRTAAAEPTRSPTAAPPTATRTAAAEPTRSPTAAPPTATRTSAAATAVPSATSSVRPTTTAMPPPASATPARPIELAAVRDAWIDAGNASRNRGIEATLQVRSASSIGRERRTLVAVDLSSIPSGVCVSAARLRLQLTGAPAARRTVDAHRVTQPWTEGRGTARSGVTWLTRDGRVPWLAAGGAFSGMPSASTSVGTTAGVAVEWDVTADVAAFVRGSLPNNGWLLRDAASAAGGGSGGGEVLFASRQHTVSAWRPRVVVTTGCR